MGQTGRGHNLSDLGKERVFQFRMPTDEYFRHIIAQGHADTRHFQGVGEAVVYKDTSRQGEHLCLVLQTTERGRENESVVVAFELRPVIVPLRMFVLLSEPFVGYKLLPIHHN